ncbi:DNA helicase RecQ [Enterococcus asini]|uniref:DNA helicase RecQ n=1 Tax=Enterococcus asini TaxID=57732 RepID=UPI00241FA339|nr:DNA helicase RecQ [Enterococcus asini]
MENATRLLQETFGYQGFRPGQEELIRHVLEKKNVLGIMPTGGGKSICYQLPALLLPGVTLVVSPLIALMKDQVDALVDNGIPATFLNSSLSAMENQSRLQDLAQGRYKLLYVAPERLQGGELVRLLSRIQVSLIAVDEAHCISQWGHDFRPSYLALPTLLATFSGEVPVIALTATATPQVAKDIQELLAIPDENLVQTSFQRENLAFSVVKEGPDTFLLEYLRMNQSSAGILYCATRKEVEKQYQRLQHAGIKVGRYHGGLSEQERTRNQEGFIYDRIQVMVATNAFGMGIDKSNVRFVIHQQIPGNLESYYQEAGRAGRDGGPSEAILLYSPQDIQIQHYFIQQSEGDLAYKQQEYLKLREMNQYAHTQMCLQRYILRYFGESGSDCGRCSNCLDEGETVEITREAQMVLSCVKRMGERFGKGLVVQVLSGSKNQKVTQWQFETLSTYGLMKDWRQKDLTALVEYLTASGYLDAGDGQFPALRLTNSGVAVLKGEETVYRKQPKVRQLETDDALFERLRQKRNQLAQAQNLPPYVVFSDQTLRELAQKQPQSRLEMLQIKGVGVNKLDKYGEDFLEILATSEK